MKRRGFLASLAGAAAIALDPERALWLPGKKLISVPRPSPIMVYSFKPCPDAWYEWHGVGRMGKTPYLEYDETETRKALQFHRNAFALVAPRI